MEDDSLADEEGLWFILLGKRFDGVPEAERDLQRLCSEFYVGRKNIIQEHYGSKEAFIEAIQSSDREEARKRLLTVWAKKKWEQKSKGKELELDSEFATEMIELEEQGTYIHELEDSYFLIWPSQSRARVLMENGGVQGTLQDEAHPIIVRRDGDDQVEVRGGQRRVNRFSRKILKSEDVQEIEPEYTDESIIDDLSILFEKDLGTLKLTEIQFLRTYLPDNSSIALKNKKGILRDLNDDNIRDEIIDYQSLSELDYFKFEHIKTGKSVKVDVKHSDEGFRFELDDSYLPEQEKRNIREHLSDQLGIEFDMIYAYDAQHDEPHIVNKILAGKTETYDQYYDELAPDDRAFIDRFLQVDEETIFVCYRCQEEHDKDVEECEECGNDTLRDEVRKNLSIKESEVSAAIFEKLQDIDNTDFERGTVSLRNINFGEKTLSGNDIVRSTFWLEDSSEETVHSHRYEYFIYGLGNGRLPHRINQYMLNTVLILYGNSYFKNKREFGVIDLYSLLQEDDVGDTLVDAILKSKSLLQERLQSRARDAAERLQELREAVDEDRLEEWGEEENYDSKNFEKDVFYLLKLMFIFTERWGREGLRESDGCLIIPHNSEEYGVFSYDPKLTYDPQGYDLNAEEKDKAAYYILSENNNQQIQELRDGKPINGHIFVSDNFRETQFDTVTEQVHNWFDLVQGDKSEEALSVPIIYLPLDPLIDIFDLFNTHWEFLMHDTHTRDAFTESIIEAFDPGREDHIEISSDTVDTIRDEVLRARRQSRQDRAVQEYGDR